MGDCWERGGNFFQDEFAVFTKKTNKLKSEIFNDKEVYEQKMFFSVINKDFNWEIFNKEFSYF